MAQSFNCPNCGAPLDYEGTDLTVRCPFCSSSVIVPETLRPAAPAAGRSHSPEVMGLDTLIGQASNLRDIARLIRAGKKIEAIKVYRETFDVGLAEAKTAVEALESGMPVVMPGKFQGTGLSLADLQIKVAEAIQSANKIEAIRLYRANYPDVPLHQAQSIIEKFVATGKLDQPIVTPPPARDPSIDTTDPQAQVRADIARLLRENNKIQAIKLYRQVSNADLKEAKDAVEAYEAGGPLEFKRGIYRAAGSSSRSYTNTYTNSGSKTTTTNVKTQNSRNALLGWAIIVGFAVAVGLVGTFVSTSLWPNTLRIAAPFFCQNGYDDAYGIKEAGGLALHCIVNPGRNITHSGILVLIPLFFFYFLVGGWFALAIGFVRISGNLLSAIFLLPLATLLLPVIFWATDVPAGNNQDTFWLLFTTRSGTRFTPPPLEQWLSGFSFATKTLVFGAEGTSPSYFNDPRSIAVDSQGTIYVADYDPGRIQVFDSDGNFVNQWTMSSDKYVYDMAIAPDNVLYAIVSGDLHSYNSITGQPLHEFSTGDSFNNFEQVGVEPDGSVVVASDDELTWFSADGQVLRTSDKFDELLGTSLSPSNLAVDKAGNIYLVSSSQYQVFIFSSQGKVITKFGSEGDADDQFDFSPDALAVDAQGRIFVDGNYSLKVFDNQGTYLSDAGIEGNAGDLAFTPQNDLLFVDRSNNQIVQYHINK